MKRVCIGTLLLFIVVSGVFSLEPGDPFVKIALPDLNRKFHRTADIFDGSWVILDFFRTDCKPCIKELPEIDAMLTKLQKNGVNIKGYIIATDSEGASIVRNFFGDYQTVMTILLDRFQKMAERYDVETIPFLYLINPEGKIAFKQNGYSETLVADLERILIK